MSGSASDYRNRLIAAREKLGLSRKAMARLLLTPWQTYSQWETGTRRTPGIAVIAAEDAVRLRQFKPAGIDWKAELSHAVEHGETMPKMAARLGIKRGTVWRAAKRNGITLPHDRAGARRDIDWNTELRVALDRGETGEECAHRLGVSPKTPYKAAARLGIKFRPRDSRRAVRPAIRRSGTAELAKQKPSAPRDILRDGRWEKI